MQELNLVQLVGLIGFFNVNFMDQIHLSNQEKLFLRNKTISGQMVTP